MSKRQKKRAVNQRFQLISILSNLKGISTVVTTLIIIFLVLVAVGILWIVVKDILEEKIKIAKARAQFFSEHIEIKIVKFNLENNLILNITLQKLTGIMRVENINYTESQPLEVDIISVADLSGSMCDCINISCRYNQQTCESICGSACQGGIYEMINANLNLVDTFFESETNSRIGLVGYSGSIIGPASISLTNNPDNLKDKINSWQAAGGTCICCGINNAMLKLQTSEKMKAIIVMSDGQTNVRCAEQGTGNARQDAINAACDANSTLTNLTIYSVGLGENVDENTLRDISECGNGKYFSAENVSDLINIYETVAEEIKKEYKSKHKFNHIKMVFCDEFDSVDVMVDVPEILKSEKYHFNLEGKLTGPIKKIEIYPVVIVSGKEVVGPLLDVWAKT